MNFVFRFHTISFFLLAWVILCSTSITLYSQTRPSSEQVSIERRLIDGKKYTLLGEWDKAEGLFRAVLSEDVQNSVACYELSRTLSASGKGSEALTYIQKAIRIDPENEWYLLMEADIHEKTGDLHATMALYDRLIALRPDKGYFYEMQISLCKKTGEQERLLKLLDRYEELRGVNESITRTRFETLDSMGRTEEALATLQKLTEAFPFNTDYKFLSASYAKKIGQEEKAKQYYRDILAIDPENSRAKLAMASSEKLDGDDIGYLQSITPVITNPGVEIDVKLRELIPYVVELSTTRDSVMGRTLLDLIQQLVRTHPTEAKSYAIQGDVLSILGNEKESIDSYTQSTALNGSVYAVWEQLLTLLMKTRSYDLLIKQAQLAIENFPNQGYLYYAAGFGLYKKEQYNQALDMLNEALIMTGRNAVQKISVYNILGLVYDELGDLEKSTLAFESALSINPKSAETLAHYSLMLSRRIAASEKAMDMTQKVINQGNQPPMIHEILAQVFYNQKKYNEAYSSIQQVLQAEPYGDTYNLAGDILIKLNTAEEAVKMWQMALDNGCTDTQLKSKIAEHKSQ
jgi:tetratricopeptide (TPR) repeat protein